MSFISPGKIPEESDRFKIEAIGTASTSANFLKREVGIGPIQFNWITRGGFGRTFFNESSNITHRNTFKRREEKRRERGDVAGNISISSGSGRGARSNVVKAGPDIGHLLQKVITETADKIRKGVVARKLKTRLLKKKRVDDIEK